MFTDRDQALLCKGGDEGLYCRPGARERSGINPAVSLHLPQKRMSPNTVIYNRSY
jgi:hypothetical protein